MKKKRLIIFMPSIEGGGVEKNLFIISNYLAIRFDKTILITTSRKFNNKFNNLKIINPNFKFNNNHGRKLRYFYCLFELFKLLIKKELMSEFKKLLSIERTQHLNSKASYKTVE